MSENKNIINEQEPQDDHMIEGRNAVLEAFRAGKTIDKLYIQDGLRDGVISSILRDAKKKDVIVNFVSKEKLDQMSPDRKHQGVMAITAAFSYAEVDDILEKAKEKGEDPFIFILDEIEDPHNLGAIIRTANLCGAHGVIIPKRRAVGLTATVVKASAGAIHYTPVAKVTNIAKTIEHVGICGEHGGDPSSVEFCHKIGLDYVSCSPFRVPIARLAAAQAAIAEM